ncbi:MAG: tetratricopeptide repeat protein [Planctomycetota bacterium]
MPANPLQIAQPFGASVARMTGTFFSRTVFGCVLLMSGFVFSSTSVAQSSDRVISTDGVIAGKFVAASANGVDIEDRNGEIKKVPIEKIREVQFADEPQSLKSARGMLFRGRAADALEELAKIDPTELEGAEPALIEEVAFVKAAAAGHASLRSGTDPKEAGKLVNDFLSKHPQTHHFYALQELLGDLLARLGKPEPALVAYSQLDKGPSAFRVRAASAKATMFFDQKKYQEALNEFEAAIKIDATDDASLAQKRGAGLGKARCFSQLGKNDEAIALVHSIIKQADPEEKELLARAYNVLGGAYRTLGGKDQDALISFLTVDLVYNSNPDSHAEALANLSELWESGKNPERAREARQNLEASYPGSQWAKKPASTEKS